MKTHWKDMKLQDKRTGLGDVPMSRHYLFNENGLMLGRVEKTSYGQYLAYAGRPGVFLAPYETLGQAKAAVEATMKQ